MLSRQEKYEEAIEMYDKALDRDANYAYTLNNKGFALLKLNQIDEAHPLIQKSLELNDKNSHAHYTMGHYHLKVSNTEKALSSFEKAKELDMLNELEDLDDKISELNRKINPS